MSNPNATNLIELDTELYNLTALHQAYKELLDQAVQQLNNLELTDRQLTTLSCRMSDDPSVRRDIANRCANLMQQENEALIDAVASRVLDRISDRLESDIAMAVRRVSSEQEHMITRSLRSYVDDRVIDRVDMAARNQMSDNLRLQQALASALSPALKDIVSSTLEQMAQAAEEAAAAQAAAAASEQQTNAGDNQ